MTDPELLRAAREQAEHDLDGLLGAAVEDLSDVPTEQRFDLLMRALAHLNPGPAMLAAVCVVAMERILAREQMEDDLAGCWCKGPESSHPQGTGNCIYRSPERG